MNKKGISSIIATLLLIVLTIVLVVVVWSVVNNLVRGKISQTSACFGNFDEVSLNNLYSCYNSTSKSMQFSLNIGNINPEGVLVSISSESQSKSFTITSELQSIDNLTYYDKTTPVKLPGKNSGVTYLYGWDASVAPGSIQIAPLIDGQQCSVSDSITSIDDCTLL
jgi:flagellin-like protein